MAEYGPGEYIWMGLELRGEAEVDLQCEYMKHTVYSCVVIYYYFPYQHL